MPRKRKATEPMPDMEFRVTRSRSSRMVATVEQVKPSPFSGLPNEMVAYMLRFLDKKSLKECSLVEKRFNDIIKSNLKIMPLLPLTVRSSIFPFVFRENREESVTDILDFKRRYTDVLLIDIETYKWSIDLMNGLQIIGKDVARLTIIDCSFCLNDFGRVLKCFPNLKSLEVKQIKKIFLYDDDYEEMATVNQEIIIDVSMLPKLKTLKIYEVPDAFIPFVNFKFDVLHLSEVYFGYFKDFLQLLSHQTSMDELFVDRIYGFPDEIVLTPLMPDLKIKKFGYIDCRNEDTTVEKFADFLMLFKNAVRNYNMLPHIEEKFNLVNETILTNFKKLQRLSIFIRDSPFTENFFRRVKANHSLKRLVCAFNSQSNNVDFRGLLTIFPGVENLTLLSIDNGCILAPGDVEFFNQKLKNLKRLDLDVTDISPLNNEHFKKLATLKVRSVIAPVDWEKIYVGSPSLQNLEICDIVGDHFDFELLIKSLKSLRNLTIHRGFLVTPGILKLIKDYGNLRMLKIDASAWQCELEPVTMIKDLGIEKLKIIFIK